MLRVLIIAATIATATSSFGAEDSFSSNSPSFSERGSNFPGSAHGPAYPATPSVREPAPPASTPTVPRAQRTIARDASIWNALHIGAGGYVRGIDIKCDQGVGQCSSGVGTSTIVTRMDTYGAYLWNASAANCGNANRIGCQQLLITPSSMPATAQDIGHCAFNKCGVMDIVIAPSNTSHFYMYLGDGCIYSSTNKGANWTKLAAFTCVTVGVNAGDGTPSFNHYLAVDPANENVLLVGTPSSGVYYTIDGGMAFTRISTSTIPAGGTSGLSQGGGNLIAFDPHSAVSGGQTQGIYVSSYGGGIFHTTTGITGKWSPVASGPSTAHRNLVVDASGTVWFNDGNLNLWRLSSGSWTEVIGSRGVTAVAYDPNNCPFDAPRSCHIYAITPSNTGALYISTNGGTSFVGPTSGNSRVATDIPYLQNTNEVFMTTGDIAIDPSTGLMWLAEGIGVWNTTPPTTNTAVRWTSVSAAIEQLVSNWVVSPVGGNPLFTFWDRPIFVSSGANIYPSHHGVNYDQSIVHGWSVDCVPATPSTCVVLANTGGIDTSGYTTNGGGNGAPSNWTQFSAIPTDISPSGSASGPIANFGGTIAASTTSDFMICVQNQSNCSYTTDGGSTWTIATPPGVERAATALTNGSTSTSSTTLHFASVPGVVQANPTWYRVSDYNQPQSIGNVIGATSTTVIVASPPSRTVNSGDSIAFSLNGTDPAHGETGWGFAYYTSFHPLCADAGGGGVYYGYNHKAPGIFKFTKGGSTVSLVYKGLFPNSGTNDALKCVPGNPGDMFYTAGFVSGLHPNSDSFYECIDSAGRVSCSAVANVTDAWAFGFGAPKPAGGGYPTIYCYCAVGGVTGYWRSTDHARTWTQIGAALQNTLDTPVVMAGDSNVYGRVYVGFSGSGFMVGQIN